MQNDRLDTGKMDRVQRVVRQLGMQQSMQAWRGWLPAMPACLHALLLFAVAAGVLLQAQGTANAASGIAQGSLTYARGYALESYAGKTWLCYGWSNGAYHCTVHWHRDASGRLISDNPSWVPNTAVDAALVTTSTSSGNVVVNGVLNEGFCAGQPVSFANISQWAVPKGCYAGVYNEPVRGFPSWGWCNELAEAMHPWLGRSVAALHLPSHGGYTPKVGATVYYAPGVQGASAVGHYSVVVAVGPNGWILSADENFYWRGGGFGKVIYRFVHLGAGVDFRY